MLTATMASDQKQALRVNFNHMFELIGQMKLAPGAVYETHKGVRRCVSGIPIMFNNAVLNVDGWKGDWDQCVDEQLEWFGHHKMPFSWFIDENSNPALEETLRRRGFHDIGVLQGVVGDLDASKLSFEQPAGYAIERILDESSVKEFTNLVCDVFNLAPTGRDLFAKSGFLASQGNPAPIEHWVAKQNSKIVAGISTLFYQNTVSFWNGATVTEYRRQGLSTALRCTALQNGLKRGAQMGASYLMPEAMALGICRKLGYETKWRFQAFVAPTSA